MSNIKRYSLLSINKNINTIVKVTEYDDHTNNALSKEKVSLATIDLLTSNFSSVYEFNRYFDLPIDSKLSIVYQANKQQKVLPCVFSDNLLIRYFANVISLNDNKITVNDECFRKFLNRFFISICNGSVKTNIMFDRTINTYIKDKIMDYLQFDNDEVFTLKKLELELQNYKNLRSVILNVMDYEKKNNIKIFSFDVPVIDEYLPTKEPLLSRFIPDDIMEEPPFPPNSLEEARYNAYLDSLPNEYICHEESHGYEKNKQLIKKTKKLS